MDKVYVVEYIYRAYNRNHEEKVEKEILGIFDTFLRGVAYLRKFYNGEEDDDRKYRNEYIEITERKDGSDSAEACRCYDFDDWTQSETLRLYAMGLNDAWNPNQDIIETLY